MQYLPSTFDERGVNVPFTSEVVRNARLRGSTAKNREFLLPGLSGGEGTYVVPFKALSSLVDLNMYDQALLDGLNDLTAITPFDLRQVILDMDARGYGGVPRTRAAKREIKNAEDVRLFNQCLLIVRALKLLADDSLDLDLKVLITPEGQKLAKEQFRSYAEKSNTTPDEIMQKLERWARLTGTIGVKNADHPGYLRQTYIHMQAMTADIKEYLSKEPPEVQFMGRGINDSAKLTSEIANREMEKCWSFEQDIGTALTHADRTMKLMEEHVQTISWIIDGWPRLIEAWNESSESFRGQRRKVLEMIYENLPILPKSVLIGDQIDKLNGIRETQKGWVKANTDWRTEQLDQEMLGRLTQFKTVDQ
ncbi:MAG TPA: hypothetical protein DCG04_09405 [Rhodospirillaceae bacterium]|nr:hypothetical protein [Rhodospirillaceae bacterium]MAX62495.1 hypothetical protein [Rhodospirillaceae bacterium]MAX65096.1 hypothetical protein [Rhodospirillaceae bacterium]MBB56893.1 hypothetical protein [Rhodospirillaceae bacterium]HAE01658.1 hypothetical protein [Rhodospirillaceae bacterium]|tara:strand:+ start:77233 stop:78324 length:1092 start_codon:yes stop_codon:yes gene_type:complete